MANYAKRLPADTAGQPLQEFATPYKAEARTLIENAAASTAINIDEDASVIEVANVGSRGALIRWVPTTETAGVSPFGSVTAATYDNFVAPNTLRRFVVPKETQGIAGPVAVGSVNGLYQRVAVADAGFGASSILVAQF